MVSGKYHRSRAWALVAVAVIAAGMARPAPTLAVHARGSALDSAGLATPPRSILPSLLRCRDARRPRLPGRPLGARQSPQLHGGRPPVHQPGDADHHPRRRGRLGVDVHLVSECGRRGVGELRRLVHGPRRADGARPRHRLARRQLGLQRELDRDRARGLHQRHPLPRRPVPRIGQAGGLDRGHLPDHARPHACASATTRCPTRTTPASGAASTTTPIPAAPGTGRCTWPICGPTRTTPTSRWSTTPMPPA